METLAENLIVQNNLSMLADVTAMGALIFSLGYIEEMDDIPMSSLMKKSKKKKVTH